MSETFGIDDAVDIRAIAHICKVSRQRASVLVAKHDFPAAVARIGRSRVWNREEVEAWAKTRRNRPGRPRRHVVIDDDEPIS